MSDLGNMDPDAGMDGAAPDGSDSGSGNVFIGQDIYSQEYPTIRCIPPCNFIFPPITLSSATTISFEPYTTSLEVVWITTTATTLENGVVSTSTGYSRTIQTTTLTVPPVTTTAIDAWNWNITRTRPQNPVYRLSSSILPPPFRITNDINTDLTTPGVTPTPVVRSITPPPYPWSTNDDDQNPFPTVSFTSGPPGPLCTSGCGQRCRLFCDGPCARDCSDGGKDFYDPQDPDPPGKPGCRGPDCENGKCRGELCMYVGCEGDDCDKGICSGGNCHPVGCSGDDCRTNGHCSGSDCIVAGCAGPGCNGVGFCFGLSCFSFGCVGQGCGSNHACSGPKCRIVTCTGRNCQYGVCTGKGCTPGSDQDGCDSGNTAPQCTEYVEPSTLNAGGTTTTTSTACRTITACGAEATTTTTTIDPDSKTITQKEGYFNAKSTGSKLWTEIRSSLTSKLSAWNEAAMSGGTKPTTTSITKPPSTTTTGSNPPNPTAADGCAIMDGTQGVCWKKCDPKTSKPVNDEYSEGDPWCWLKSGNIGAFCNKANDCPSEFECQPNDWEHGGCAAPKPVSGGCALMDGTQGVCWSKCDPKTSEPVTEQWNKGDPWCWLKSDDIGAFCNDSDECSADLQCQPASWNKGGCSMNTQSSLLSLSDNRTSNASAKPHGLRLDLYQTT